MRALFERYPYLSRISIQNNLGIDKIMCKICLWINVDELQKDSTWGLYGGSKHLFRFFPRHFSFQKSLFPIWQYSRVIVKSEFQLLPTALNADHGKSKYVDTKNEPETFKYVML